MPEKLAYLHKKHIPAVLFCRGDFLERHSKIAIQALELGFIIGNHSYCHPSFSDITLEQCFEEITCTDEIIAQLYQSAGILREHKYFRFPYGDKGGLRGPDVYWEYSLEENVRKELIQEHLCKLGYVQPLFEDVTYKYFRKAGLLDDLDWYWTYDCLEWATRYEQPPYGIRGLKEVLERIRDDLPIATQEGWTGLQDSRSSEIIVIHDHLETSEMFIPIVEQLLQCQLIFWTPS